jgi:hypothetical protein
MSGAGFDMKDVNRSQPAYPAIRAAILFIIPSIVITAISVILFSQLRGFTPRQMNVFSITIISAVVLSSIGMAAVQLLIYRIIDNREYFKEGAPARAINVGLLCSFLFSIAVSAIAYPYFTRVLRFSITEYSYFPLLLLMYSAIWVYSSAFWAAQKHVYPALIFTLSYLSILGLTLYANRTDQAYTLLAYSLGTALLFIVLLITSSILFRKPGTRPKFTDDLSRTSGLVSRSVAAILFSIFYVTAIFLDKIIVWVYQGQASGEGLLVTGTYTMGAFLGLVPLFNIGVLAYFTRRTLPISDQRYSGTLREIQRTVIDYKGIYWTSIRAMLVAALGLFVLTVLWFLYFISDPEILKVLITTSAGSIFFSAIVLNSLVLPLFGKTGISTFAVFVVIIFEILSIRFVPFDVWYASVGYLLGSFAGFLISMSSTMRLFYHFEHNMFRHLLHSD